MKIANSAIQFYSKHTLINKTTKDETLEIWGKGQDPTIVTNDGDAQQDLGGINRSIVGLSTKVTLSSDAKMTESKTDKAAETNDQNNEPTDLNLKLLQWLFERLTGHKMQLADIAGILSGSSDTIPTPNAPATSGFPGNSQSSGSGLIYQYQEVKYESESTSFAAQGTIVTQSGQEVDFTTQLSMNRESSSSAQQTIKMGDAVKDPLVINLDGASVQLTQTRFSFDLNNDGINKQMAFVSPGSGFLALDKNGNNTIDNGSELFGPGTGNGFSELSAYDSDNKSWIDENDPVYNKLKVWTKSQNGQDILLSLQQAGVGAIFLGSTSTPFSMLTGPENNLLGKVRSTGIFVSDSGSVGTLQQVDIVA